MNCSQIVDHHTEKTCVLLTQPPIKHLRHIRELGGSKEANPFSRQLQQIHSLFSTEWKFKKKQKSRRNKNSKVLFHRKSYTTKWTSIGVRDFFQWNQWILETWGSRRQAVYNEPPNNKIEFYVTIYRFLFTFFKIIRPFSSDSPFQILRAS